jgi:hypothetical protein
VPASPPARREVTNGVWRSGVEEEDAMGAIDGRRTTKSERSIAGLADGRTTGLGKSGCDDGLPTIGIGSM